jgi:maltooligosyltrehalose trehalohydrolase
MKFSVWAPFAKTVDLRVGEKNHPMHRIPHGTWEIEMPLPPGEIRYRYSIDGGPPLPDPRSPWQPEGVHGDSHWMDPSFFDNAKARKFRPKPLRDAVIYELHVGTFTPAGTYRAAQAKLPHLAELGVTHIEIMPLATFPGGRGWGYDGVYLYAPFPSYGTPQELAQFVGACHDHGLAVLLDVVYNHFGPDGSHAGKFGPYFTDRWKTVWGEAMNFDGPQSDEVRRFVIDNAVMWLRDYGFDGLRLDAVHAIFCSGAVHILEELAQRVESLGRELQRDFVVIAENDTNDPRLVRARERGGYGLSAHWCDDFHHAIHAFCTGEKDGYYADFQGGLADVATVLRQGYLYQGQFSQFRQRRHGRPSAGVAPQQLIVCSQNHDQIGNRALGERLSMLRPLPQLKAVAALTLLSPFVPLLFQGEEWGAQTPFLYFTDHQDPALASAVVAGRRREFAEFGWKQEIPNPQDVSTFRRSQLEWRELQQPAQADLLGWYKRLISLRQKVQATSPQPATEVSFDEKAGWLTLRRGEVLAVFTFAAGITNIPLPTGRWRIELASDQEDGVPAWRTQVFLKDCSRTDEAAAPG